MQLYSATCLQNKSSCLRFFVQLKLAVLLSIDTVRAVLLSHSQFFDVA